MLNIAVDSLGVFVSRFGPLPVKAVSIVDVPLVATLGAWVLLGERPAPVQGLGAALVISGVLVSRQPAPRE